MLRAPELKDHLDNFYAQALDQEFEIDENTPYLKKLNKNDQRKKETYKGQSKYLTSTSTPAETTDFDSDSSINSLKSAVSIFKSNHFEEKPKNKLKIKDVLKKGWEQNTKVERRLVVQKLFKAINSKFLSMRVNSKSNCISKWSRKPANDDHYTSFCFSAKMGFN